MIITQTYKIYVNTTFNGLLLVHIKNTATGITSERDTTEPVKWDKVLLLALAIPTIGIIFNVVCSSIK